MKYVVMLGDGMADTPVPELGGKTPLGAARKPAMDYIARNGVFGLVKTVPDGVEAGSETANMSILGYDPRVYHTGRSPIEAVSMGAVFSEKDVAIRCNLVTLSGEDDYAEKSLLDYSAGEIPTGEAKVLINELQSKLGGGDINFYTGTSYRHCVIWKNGKTGLNLAKPHDISGKKISGFLPRERILYDLTVKSCHILNNHPINKDRVKRGLNPANSIWLWGEGTKFVIPPFEEKYGVKGAVIAAVDLMKGIAISARMDAPDVPGATGNFHTDYAGKKDAAVRELKSGKDFVYIHVEAPDECGHRRETENKVRSIELIDEKILAPLLEELKQFGDYKILLLPDHPTPLALGSHTGEPVPFAVYDSRNEKDSGADGYDEAWAAKTGVFVAEGHKLIDMFLN